MDEKGIVFTDVDQALSVPQTDIRLFGKPEAYTRRRMGVALAYGDDIEDCRQRAKQCAATVKTIKNK